MLLESETFAYLGVMGNHLKSLPQRKILKQLLSENLMCWYKPHKGLCEDPNIYDNHVSSYFFQVFKQYHSVK